MTIKAAVSAIMIFALPGCAGEDGAKSGVILGKNFADISVREPKKCNRITLYKKADGSLWIGNPAKAR